MLIPDNMIFERIAEALKGLLPPGWELTAQTGKKLAGAKVQFTSVLGESQSLSVVVKRRIDPRMANQLPDQPDMLVVAPYLSRFVCDALKKRGINYADQTGNTRVSVRLPGLFILTHGANKDPWPVQKSISLRGIKAGRIVQAMIGTTLPLGVRKLAIIAGTHPGYVSRLVKKLDEDSYLERTPRGQIAEVDWRRLLAQWAEDAPVAKRSIATTWIAPRGLKHFQEQLTRVDLQYVLTGSAAASQIAPVTPTRIISIYVDDPIQAASVLGLRQADAGANIILLQPEDDALYTSAIDMDGLKRAPLPLLVVDLLTGPGRSPSEAEALMDWMESHEDMWRG